MSPDFTLTRDGNVLSLTDAAGVVHHDVRALRLFPLTDPHSWVRLQDSDGQELACIEDPQTLPPASREALTTVLAHREFVPVIQRIHRISRAADGHEWEVVTDRGQVTFRVETDESIQSLGTNRLVIVDAKHTRYLLPDVAALDIDSRRKLERYF